MVQPFGEQRGVIERRWALSLALGLGRGAERGARSSQLWDPGPGTHLLGPAVSSPPGGVRGPRSRGPGQNWGACDVPGVYAVLSQTLVPLPLPVAETPLHQPAVSC